MCKIPDDKHSHPGMLLSNKQIKKSVTNDSCKKETVDSCKKETVNDSDDDDCTDDFYPYHYDSDDEEDQLKKALIEQENSAYTLTAGTLITFIQRSVFNDEHSVTCRIETIKDDCDTNIHPLVVLRGRVVVDSTMYLRVEGKKHAFCFRSVKLKPGTVMSPTKKIKKLPTMDEQFQHCLGLQDEEEEGRESSNSKNDFIVPIEVKITFREMKDHNLHMKYIPGMDQYSFPTKDLDDVINDSTAPIISISVEMNVVQRMLNTPRPKSNKLEDEIAFDEDRKCTNSIIDIDSFWRFQNTSKQRLMISLPSDIYTFFDGLPNTTCNLCFEWLQKRLPNCD